MSTTESVTASTEEGISSSGHDRAAALTASQNSATKATPPQPRPSRPLPTHRLTIAKQLDILRGYTVASGPGKKSVNNSELSRIVQLHQNTVSLVNPFFYDCGLIERATSGYIPRQEVFDFARAHQFNVEQPGQKLAPLFRDSWFAQRLLPLLQFRTMPETEALAILAEDAKVGLEFKTQLSMLIDYLEIAGLVKREGGQVRIQDQQENHSSDKDSSIRPDFLGSNPVNDEAEDKGGADKSRMPKWNVGDSYLLVGLFQKLPSPGTVWPAAERDKWISTIQHIFSLEYRDEESSQ